MGEKITGIFVLIMAAIALVLSIFHFVEKGPLLNNAYLYSSQRDRAKMNKKPYYRQSAISFLLVSLAMASLGLHVLTQVYALFILAIVAMIVAVIYAVVSGAMIDRKK